jgi:hypothetical protein
LRLAFWTGIALFVPLAAFAQNPCAAHPTQPHWRVFADSKYGFCFEYPPDYRRITPSIGSRRCSRKDGCLLSLEKKAPPSVPPDENDEFKNATIDLSDLGIPFDLGPLRHYAPTGLQDETPEPRQVGSETFYYYGPGGGGVTYPDQFFFKVKGRAFTIDFDGPYTDDKTPADITKQIEGKLLASFRHF